MEVVEFLAVLPDCCETERERRRGRVKDPGNVESWLW